MFTEAEAAFRKAAELSPEFWNAWDGIAYAKYFAGDAAGAREALAKARDIAPRPGDKLAIKQLLAAMADAQGNTAEALRILGASETLTEAPGVAFVPVIRATVLNSSGKYREALPLIAAGQARAASGELPAGASRNLRVQALRARVSAEAGMGNAAAAEQSAAALTKEASVAPDTYSRSPRCTSSSVPRATSFAGSRLLPPPNGPATARPRPPQSRICSNSTFGTRSTWSFAHGCRG